MNTHNPDLKDALNTIKNLNWQNITYAKTNAPIIYQELEKIGVNAKFSNELHPRYPDIIFFLIVEH